MEEYQQVRKIAVANYRDTKETESIRSKVVLAAAQLFFRKGFSNSTVKEIATAAEVKTSTLMYEFGSKEEILRELMAHTLEMQFEETEELLKDKTDDPVLFYATETVLQLHIAERNEHLRELYGSAYSLPKTTEIIQKKITGKLEELFKEYLPKYETKDFFEIEIALGGIMRGFMMMPCDMYFTMERKVKRFLKSTFLVCQIPEEKIEEA